MILILIIIIIIAFVYQIYRSVYFVKRAFACTFCTFVLDSAAISEIKSLYCLGGYSLMGFIPSLSACYYLAFAYLQHNKFHILSVFQSVELFSSVFLLVLRPILP